MTKACSKCKAEKPTDAFYKDSKGRLSSRCKGCQQEVSRQWATSPGGVEKRHASNRRHYEKSREKRKAQSAAWLKKHPEKRREIVKRWEAKNPGYRNKIAAKVRARNREASFAAYGGFVCACCGESEPMFLTIDHIHNDGASHRKLLRNTGGSEFFAWLRRNKFPKGFQVLCRNCNWGKHANKGICPHQNSEGSTTISQESTSQAIGDGSAERPSELNGR